MIDIIIKKNNKRIYIRPKYPNLVKITTPIKLSISKLEDILLKNYDFIKKVVQSAPLKLSSNKLHFFGKEYNIEIKPSLKNYIELNNDAIYIYAKSNDEITIKAIINKFYTENLKKFVEKEIAEAKNKLGILFNLTIKYKNVKTYFGQCMPKRKIVTFSTKLAKYDEIYIKSVIYHELAHFYYLNHGKDFYLLLESVFPGYMKTHKELKRIKFTDIY